MSTRNAEIRMTKQGARPMVELTVPFGTKLAETTKLHDFLTTDVISKLSPRGCETCTSGVDILIRERFEDVLFVDLDTMKFVQP
jgi:hypothetical protein